MKKLTAFLLIFLLILGLFPNYLVGAAKKDLKVHFIDVGQGDSILIQAPGGKTMLVDGGPTSSGKKVLSFLESQGVKKLDYVVATHPDADHIGGLISVLNSIPVSHFIDSGKVHNTQTYYEMLSIIDKKNINFIVPKTLDSYKLDPNMNLRVLHANENAVDANDASIVLKLTYNKVSFLLMGDANTEIEDQIRSKYKVDATVIKLGHHGSDTSSSAAFISNVKPKVAILSYGKNNSYGHPNDAVVSRLKKVGAKTYQTPLDCDITISTNGIKHSASSGCKKQASGKVKTPTPPVKSPAKVVTGFKNCTELRKVYPDGVPSSHPAYLSKFDRDKDGWGCEK